MRPADGRRHDFVRDVEVPDRRVAKEREADPHLLLREGLGEDVVDAGPGVVLHEGGLYPPCAEARAADVGVESPRQSVLRVVVSSNGKGAGVSPTRIIGIALVVIGPGLDFWGYQTDVVDLIKKA
jgi:hypothetical protein